MKRLISILAAFMVAALPLAATENSNAVKEESKSFNVDSFDAIQVSWIYKVELTQARNHSVVVEAPDFVMPYLDVRVRRSCLILDMHNMPKDIKRKLETGRYDVRAYVSMKKLSKLEMSGASKLEANGAFQTSDNSFDLLMSGASNSNGLVISAQRAFIDCSGASKFQMEGKIKDVHMELSGAAKGTLLTDGKKMDLDISGASKLNLTGDQDDVRVIASGAANIKMNGTVGKFDLSGSGACKIDMLDCPALWVNIGLSGASNARLEVLETLGVRLSGASTCQYRAGDKLQIVETDVARGSTLRKL